jgi:signal transduction histidine kinase
MSIRVSRGRVGGGDGVSIEVRDSGTGMAAERLATIWEPYATSKPGGTGLGLAIARQAVEANGGTVAAESELGEGTTIRFLVPAATSSSNRDEPLEQPALRTGA